MPFINGRFYANPAYGEALERARGKQFRAEFGDGLARFGGDSPEFGDELTRYGGGDVEVEPVALQRHDAPGQHSAHQQPHEVKPESPKQNANRVYNETSGLRPTTKHGPGSVDDLHTARLYIAHVLGNREATGKAGIVAPDQLPLREAHAIHTYPPAKEAYHDSLSAAQKAGSTPDPTKGAKNYYLDYGQGPPPWAAGKKPIAVFGPFVNASGGGGMHNPKKGDKVHIRIYHLNH